jgi:ribonucleoside-diphosphate reductase alpha chain
MAKDTLDKEIKWGLGKRVGGRDEWFELIGFLFGDGFKCGCGYGISVKLDPDKEPEVARMLLYNGFHRQENGAFYINNEENDLYSWVEFIDDRVWDRVLPDRYLFDNSTKSSSFLRGLFEANGSVNSHGQISLKATNLETIRRVQLAIASFGVPSWIVTNKPTDIKWKNGTYKSRQSYNLQIAPRCGTLFRDKIGFLSKRKNDRIKRFDKEYNGKLKVVSIRSLGEMEVWDYTMNDNPHYNFCQGVIAANCGEVPLPAFGACTLGSINISKMVEKDNFNFDMFHHYCELAARALLNCNIINWYPVNQIAKTMRELNPIGVGIMGFADALIMLGINYDSKECLDFIDQLCKPYVEATNNVAIDSFYHRSIAPTGSLSILANCSSGIEPVFDSIFERHLTVGVIEETRDIYTSKYLRTAHEVSPDWHLKVQAQFQKYIDAGVSKTINVSNDVDVETIKDIYIKAWKYGCKGITVFRDACKDGVLVSTRNKCEGDQCII